jgi:hypothetical protein
MSHDKIRLTREQTALIKRLLSVHAKMARQLIKREGLDVTQETGKRYLCEAMCCDSALITIEGQTS